MQANRKTNFTSNQKENDMKRLVSDHAHTNTSIAFLYAWINEDALAHTNPEMQSRQATSQQKWTIKPWRINVSPQTSKPEAIKWRSYVRCETQKDLDIRDVYRFLAFY